MGAGISFSRVFTRGSTHTSIGSTLRSTDPVPRLLLKTEEIKSMKTQSHTHTDRHTDRYTDRHADRHTNRHTDRYIDIRRDSEKLGSRRLTF